MDDPVRVTWFPPTHLPVVLSSPASGHQISPVALIRLTFSRPVNDVVGASRPWFSPNVPVSWHKTDRRTHEPPTGSTGQSLRAAFCVSAQAGIIPVGWQPAGAPVPRTLFAEVSQANQAAEPP